MAHPQRQSAQGLMLQMPAKMLTHWFQTFRDSRGDRRALYPDNTRRRRPRSTAPAHAPSMNSVSAAISPPIHASIVPSIASASDGRRRKSNRIASGSVIQHIDDKHHDRPSSRSELWASHRSIEKKTDRVDILGRRRRTTHAAVCAKMSRTKAAKAAAKAASAASPAAAKAAAAAEARASRRDTRE